MATGLTDGRGCKVSVITWAIAPSLADGNLGQSNVGRFSLISRVSFSVPDPGMYINVSPNVGIVWSVQLVIRSQIVFPEHSTGQLSIIFACSAAHY